MQLTILKAYFDICLHSQAQLQQNWSKFNKFSSYSLYKVLANKSQPLLDATLIRIFIMSFNWQNLLKQNYQQSLRDINELNQGNQAKLCFKVHSNSANMNQEQLLEYGIGLMINYWGNNNGISFDQFSQMIKGQVQLPTQIQVPFPIKKLLFQSILTQIQNLIKIQLIKSAVYHNYKNLSDLFQLITSTNKIQYQNIQRLYLSFSQRKSKKQLEQICKRVKLSWNFNDFLLVFKQNKTGKSEGQYKVFYSAHKNKQKDNISFQGNNDNYKTFTTPRKQKYLAQQSSTKVTKAHHQMQQDHQNQQTTPIATPKRPSKILEQQHPTQISPSPFNHISTSISKPNQLYIQILVDLLQIQQNFNTECSNLIKRQDFDLQLIYQKHGKKFQNILNTRYGVCNFSAFVRFIVPKDYQHRYLSFIRYQADDQISEQTNKEIQRLLRLYQEKQGKIKEIWNKCDREMFMRYFSMPNQASMRSQKLRQLFTKRQTKVLLERLDPHFQGTISLEAIN